MGNYELSLLLDWIKEEKDRLDKQYSRIDTALRRLSDLEKSILSTIQPSKESTQKAKKARGKRDE